MRWTVDQVAQQAPDPKAMVAARKLARPGPWSDTGSTDVLVWGKCQGSGSTPYQVSIDLVGPAFRCSCPSRKFPCKHALALLLLWVEGDGAVADAAEPADFAGAWQADRAARAERRAAPSEAVPTDPEAAARRRAQRLARMDAGAEELERWLGDLLREGLAGVRERGYDLWDQAAGRLVDAQLPGLAERARTIGGAINQRDDWADVLLAELGRWWAAIRAWRARELLTEDELGDLRAYLGWAVGAEELTARPSLDDEWTVLGVHRSEDGRLVSQRTWLHGRSSGATVLVLDFAAGGSPIQVPQLTGSVVRAKVAPYPGAAPARGRFAGDPVPVTATTGLPAAGSIDDALAQRAEALAANPWAERTVAVVAATLVIDDGPILVDAAGAALPLTEDVDPWPLLARCGGRPTPVVVEVEDGALRPLALEIDGQVIAR